MSDPVQRPEYGYIAYIDESGDDGLDRVKPIDASGGTEWLMIAGVVIDADRETEIHDWIKGILEEIKSSQLKNLHFSRLNERKRLICCHHIAKLPLRCFVVASNKKNMRGYRNANAAKTGTNAWFYCFLTRILLERMTLFVAQTSLRKHGSIKRLKLEFSQRGGIRYGQMAAYYEWLRNQSRSSNMYLNKGDLVWDTMHPLLLQAFPHDQRAGLKLPDIVAGSFYQAVSIYDVPTINPAYAETLQPRMARYPHGGSWVTSGFGLKLLPSFAGARMTPEQAAIFRFYGYPKEWWAADPSAPGAL